MSGKPIVLTEPIEFIDQCMKQLSLLPRELRAEWRELWKTSDYENYLQLGLTPAEANARIARDDDKSKTTLRHAALWGRPEHHTAICNAVRAALCADATYALVSLWPYDELLAHALVMHLSRWIVDTEPDIFRSRHEILEAYVMGEQFRGNNVTLASIRDAVTVLERRANIRASEVHSQFAAAMRWMVYPIRRPRTLEALIAPEGVERAAKRVPEVMDLWMQASRRRQNATERT